MTIKPYFIIEKTKKTIFMTKFQLKDADASCLPKEKTKKNNGLPFILGH